MEPKALAIVGMRRSGTSSISLVLHRLGVCFGAESQLIRGNEFNEEGYWEHRALCGVHRKFRMSLNVSVDCDPTPDDWQERPASAYFVERGVRTLQEHFLNITGPWSWKDPDASLALPFVYEVSRQAGFVPHLLICVRNPVDIARSEVRRKGTPEPETVGAWLAHTLEALSGSRSRPRTVILFSDFLKKPRHVLEPVVEALGMTPSEVSWEAAVSALRPELVHSKSGEENLDDYPSPVKRVYGLCRQLAASGQAMDDEIESCYREFDTFRRMVKRPPLEEATLGALWERANESLVSQVNYRPTGSWQTVSVDTGALPGSPVQLYLYPLPANIWIRRASWRFGEETEEAVLEPGTSGSLRQQFGLACVSLIHGPDQVVVKTPAANGPFTLELELLIDSNNLVIGEAFKALSDLCRR